ncbi:hypothetical protein GF380_06240 [Candidatus Uhrbacteria bacterium]|nr:hypothetical protein [Candidatus Uhrbacteria bacterium]MBD3284654.1 hypothetical protein [Candidatus Uhrbacteria bacterium]
MYRTIIRITIALAAFLALPLNSAFATTVSPLLFEFEIAPGKSTQETISVINDSEQTQTYTLFVENFIASGEDGSQQYLHEEIPTGLASWVVVDEPTVTIAPGERAEFPFLVNVPNDAEPGGHYATVFFSRGGASGRSTGVGITEQVGVLLLVQVPGDIKEQANVESFRITNGMILNRLPAEFELRIRNTGSVHISPRGTLVVRNLLGSVVERLPANPNKSRILPNSIRRIQSGWAKTLEEKQGGFFAELTNEWNNFAIGKYTASIDVTYGSRQTALPDQRVSFWVIPWRILIVVILIIVAIIALVKGYNALLIRSALRSSRSGKRKS